MHNIFLILLILCRPFPSSRLTAPFKRSPFHVIHFCITIFVRHKESYSIHKIMPFMISHWNINPTQFMCVTYIYLLLSCSFRIRTTAVGTGQTSGPSAPLTTGEDVSPPLKKRLLSRNANSKVQTPKSSPNTAAHVGTSPTSKNIPLASPSDVAAKSGRTSKIAVTNVQSSVHTLFATNFFNNVSQGYNVLLHTFQYLKMQVRNVTQYSFSFVFGTYASTKCSQELQVRYKEFVVVRRSVCSILRFE